MKKTIVLIAFIILTSFISTKAQYGGISFNYFYSTLSPHGEWISIDADLIVWRPTNVNYGWSPYSIGRWAWTDDGWYWDSYEPFGWAVYHYGRWHYDDYYGWVWVPDYEWAPAWVEWRYNDDYLGWAPLPPYASFRVGVGISFSINWHLHHRYWNFVRYDHFCHDRVNVYIINNSDNYRVFKNTKYRTNYYSDGGRIINRGVDRDLVERRGGYKITKREVSRVTTYDDYERSVKSRGERVTALLPDEKEVTRYRGVEKYNTRSSDGKTSLQRDKIAIRERSYDSEKELNKNKNNSRREIENGRERNSPNYERKKEINSRTKKEYSTSREKYSTESKAERKQVNTGRESKSSVGRSIENRTSKKSNSEPKKQSQTSRSKKR